MPNARPTLEVAFINGPYDNGPTYVDLSQYLRDENDITFNRGKQDELQAYDAGEWSGILDPALVGDSRRALEPLYAAGLYYPNIQPEKKIRYSLEYPWLPGLVSDYNFTAGVGSWTADANTTLSLDATRHFLKGATGAPAGSSLVLTSVAAGNMRAYSPYIPVVPGQWVAGSFRYLYISGGAIRTIDTQVEFYDASHTIIGTAFDSVLKLDSSTAWTRLGQARVAPASAAYFRYIAEVQGTGAAGEKHAICCPAIDYATLEGVFSQIVTFADDWDPIWPGGMDAYTVLTGHDGFKLLGGKNITSLGFTTAYKALNPSYYFRLGDPLNSVTARDEMHVSSPAPVIRAVVFDLPGCSLADVDTAADFTNGFIDAGTGPAWTGTGAQSVTFAYKVPLGTDRAVQQGPNSDGVSSFFNVYFNGSGGGQFSASDGVTTIAFNYAPITYDNNWHLITVVRVNTTTYRVFNDGVQLTPTNPVTGTVVGQDFVASGTCNFVAGRVLIGGANDGPAFQGQLDEFGIWNGHAMTLAEHQSIYNLMAKAWASQTTGTRIDTVLTAIGWPTADRNLDAGTQTLPAQTDPLATVNTKSYLQLVEATEGGELFMGKDGSVRFIGRQSRYKPPYSSPVAVFGDRPGTVDTATGLTELPYASDTKPTFGDSVLYTESEVTRAIPGGGSGPTQYVGDLSLGNNPQRTISRSGLLLPDDQAANDYAHWLFNFFKIALIRFNSITINALSGDSVWAQMLQREIGDRIVVVRRPPGWATGQATMRVECFIIGISGNDRRGKNTRTFQLGQVPASPMLILDDPNLGKLDANNFVGF